jgi:hypothetical protein
MLQIEPQDWEAVKQDGMLPISTVKGYGLKQLVKTDLFLYLIRKRKRTGDLAI